MKNNPRLADLKSCLYFSDNYELHEIITKDLCLQFHILTLCFKKVEYWGFRYSLKTRDIQYLNPFTMGDDS